MKVKAVFCFCFFLMFIILIFCCIYYLYYHFPKQYFQALTTKLNIPAYRMLCSIPIVEVITEFS